MDYTVTSYSGWWCACGKTGNLIKSNSKVAKPHTPRLVEVWAVMPGGGGRGDGPVP